MPSLYTNPTVSLPPKPAVEACLEIQAFSYSERRTVLPALAAALETSGCWVLERKPISVTQTAIRFEVQLRSVLDLYSALIGTGLELTRGSHLGLTGLCTLRKHQGRPREAHRILEVVLELSFLEELNLASCLLPGAALA